MIIGEFNALFTASTILPVQFYNCDTFSEYAPLHLAVLIQSILDLSGGQPTDDFVAIRENAAAARDAAAWIASDHEGPFGYITCCEDVGLDPQALREALAAYSIAGQLRQVAAKLDLSLSAPTFHVIATCRQKCRHGHPLTPEHTRVARNGEGKYIVRCNTCDAAYQRANRRKQKATRVASGPQRDLAFT